MKKNQGGLPGGGDAGIWEGFLEEVMPDMCLKACTEGGKPVGFPGRVGQLAEGSGHGVGVAMIAELAS